MMRLGFLASHGGSGMKAIIDASRNGSLNVLPVVAISNNGSSRALQIARADGLECHHVSAAKEGSEEEADAMICSIMQKSAVDLIILSGYMRKMGPRTLAAFPDRILNIHPALLPLHGGEGMYGLHVHEDVIRTGDSESGATVHIVDAHYDHGRILGQSRVPVLPADTPEVLQDRIRPVELELYVDILRKIVEGSIVL